jgi:ribonuclease Z
MRGAKPPVDIDLYEIKPGVLMEDDSFCLTAFPVDHRGPDCFGFSFQEKARRPFLEDRAEALGVPRGPERRRLVAGESIQLDDGRVIGPDDVLGDEIPGIKLCITGDVGRTDRLIEPVRDADGLVCEATYIHEEVGLARHHGHITAREAAELARQAGVRNLLLTHLSRRYRERDVLDEARAIFPEAIVVRDFDHYRIRRDQPLERVES